MTWDVHHAAKAELIRRNHQKHLRNQDGEDVDFMNQGYYELKTHIGQIRREARIKVNWFRYKEVFEFLESFGEKVDAKQPATTLDSRVEYNEIEGKWVVSGMNPNMELSEFKEKYFNYIDPPYWENCLPELEVVHSFSESSGQITVQKEILPGIYAGNRGGVPIILKDKRK